MQRREIFMARKVTQRARGWRTRGQERRMWLGDVLGKGASRRLREVGVSDQGAHGAAHAE